jgi:acyl-coenzyme A thioesterase PaaI-like protein
VIDNSFMNQLTHNLANPNFLGEPISISTDEHAEVILKTIREMVVDDKGLIHGGFTFGLADYAAMLAVNHPYVVLSKSEVKFIAPVRLGDILKAEAIVESIDGKKRVVSVNLTVDETIVFSGLFTCIVLSNHVLK